MHSDDIQPGQRVTVLVGGKVPYPAIVLGRADDEPDVWWVDVEFGGGSKLAQMYRASEIEAGHSVAPTAEELHHDPWIPLPWGRP